MRFYRPPNFITIQTLPGGSIVMRFDRPPNFITIQLPGGSIVIRFYRPPNVVTIQINIARWINSDEVLSLIIEILYLIIY